MPFRNAIEESLRLGTVGTVVPKVHPSRLGA